jgi:hypothetical protein
MIAYPQFVEGQTLSASDLNLTVDLPQSRVDRHERMLHSWGIAQGLKLVPSPLTTSKGQNFVQITLTAGMAIDPFGRQVVVPKDFVLRYQDFAEQVVVSPQASLSTDYPVFITYQETDVSGQGVDPGLCNGAQASSREEGYEVTFGAAGDEIGANDPPSAAVSVDPDRSSLSGFPILIGFVNWDASIPRFTARKADAPFPVPLRYVGVRADEVAAQSRTLTLRNDSLATSGETALQLQSTAGGSVLRYGGFDPSTGVVNPVFFSVDSQGNLTTNGTISGALTTGALLVGSGAITHGIKIPLPSGVTEDQVTSGKATVYTHLSVRYDLASPPSPTAGASGVPWIPALRELFVDDDRRVHCIVEWIDSNNNLPKKVRLGACEYVILVGTPSA